MLDRLVWLGHDGFLLQGSPTIYIDPVRIPEGPEADLVLITHGHYDHCSPADILKVATPDTVVIAPQDCAVCLREVDGELKLMEPGDRVELLGAEIEAVPAYTRRCRMHGRTHGWLGYSIRLGEERWYHAGDTDFIAEMRRIRADIACLPVSGGTVMNPIEAAAAAEYVDPGVALPMHYGTFMGSRKDAESFADRAKVPVLIPEPMTPLG